jgi:protein-tyrosine phosphatase
MWKELHWVDGPGPGRLAVAPRPQGGEWLEDNLASWRRAGIAPVLSLLTPDEEQDLDLGREARAGRAQGMTFKSLPIPDRGVASSDTEMAAALQTIDNDLASGKNELVHGRQGIGRSGLIAACLLLAKGVGARRAVDVVSAVRGIPIPQTSEQRSWIDHYASVLASPPMNLAVENQGLRSRS